jgi:alkyldihydroxyacetonephosphate synthase
MKKNKYGNIDDIVISIKIATPIGTFSRNQSVPRLSSGPDIH